MKVFDEYMQALNTIEESDEIIADGSDKDFVELAKIEKNEALEKIPGLEEELKVLLIPKILQMIKILSWKCAPELVANESCNFRGRYVQNVHHVFQNQRLETRSYRFF